jgi:hypothetical protein
MGLECRMQVAGFHIESIIMSTKQQARQRKNATSKNVDFGQSTVSQQLIETNLKSGKSVKEVVELLRAMYSNLPDISWEEIGSGVEALVEATQAEMSFKAKRAIRETAQAIKEGKDSDTLTPVELITLDEALKRFVFIKLGQQVFDLENPSAPPMPFSNFVTTYAASKHIYEDKSLALKVKPVASIWLESDKRLTVEDITYKPSGKALTVNPRGASSVNSWSPRGDFQKPANHHELATRFTSHIEWLFGDAAGIFLDWLAHIEQKPGELPHFGFIHIAKKHGLGRGWLGSVLSRVWSGNVAPAFDLIQTLEKGFNDRLSRCHLAIVDEIYEGGGEKWKHASALRQLITAEQRLINPKFGFQRVEFNVCRWLLFSNHVGAIPLDEHDRRFWVINSPDEPREESIYVGLYALLKNADFIKSVRYFLATRDISQFNAGQRPPMTEAKLELTQSAKSEVDHLASAIAQSWPVDVVYKSEVSALLAQEGNSQISDRAIANALDRVGISRWKKSQGRLRANHNIEIAYIIRNHQKRNSQDADFIRAEHDRLSMRDKENAAFGAPFNQESPQLAKVISIS